MIPPGEKRYVTRSHRHTGSSRQQGVREPGGQGVGTLRAKRFVHYASVHGLLAEEADPATGTALGNYPQVFSHIGLINSAVRLAGARAAATAG